MQPHDKNNFLVEITPKVMDDNKFDSNFQTASPALVIFALIEEARKRTDLNSSGEFGVGPDGHLWRHIALDERINSYVDRLIVQATKRSALEREIKVHDEYWHSQRLVDKEGIGSVALANKESAEAQLRTLTTIEGDSKS